MLDVDMLSHEVALPEGQGRDGVVQWHAFRSRTAAEDFVPGMQLGDGQRLVGGYTRDSIGPLWWVGVQVEDVESWGNRGAINKRGASS